MLLLVSIRTMRTEDNSPIHSELTRHKTPLLNLLELVSINQQNLNIMWMCNQRILVVIIPPVPTVTVRIEDTATTTTTITQRIS